MGFVWAMWLDHGQLSVWTPPWLPCVSAGPRVGSPAPGAAAWPLPPEPQDLIGLSRGTVSDFFHFSFSFFSSFFFIFH